MPILLGATETRKFPPKLHQQQLREVEREMRHQRIAHHQERSRRHQEATTTLDRDLAHYKQQLALKYAELVYYGQWFTPLRESIDSATEDVPASRRMRIVSSSASRVWTISGKPSSNAARIWRRNDSCCISRGLLS